MFDPEAFGRAMGEAIRAAVAPLEKEVAALKSQLADKPDVAAIIGAEVQRCVASLPAPKDGKDCDLATVKTMVDDAIKTIPVVQGKDGQDGKPGENGKDGGPGEKGADGLGVAGAMIDRDGALQVTLTNGEVKNLGPVVGKDGAHGKDGSDGIGFDAFELEYLPESHEVVVKAVCGIRTKELRYPAGGIRPAGYWREGTKAKAGEAWTHDGSTWIAKKDTSTKPETQGDDWIIAARKGRDGERGQKGIDGSPPAPIKLDAA